MYQAMMAKLGVPEARVLFRQIDENEQAALAAKEVRECNLNATDLHI